MGRLKGYGTISTMMSGTNIRQRDIVLLDFPFSDGSDSKKRPAVIIANSSHNLSNQDVICCAITTNPKKYHGSVEICDTDMEEGYLSAESKVKPNNVFRLDKSMILKRICRLNIPKSKEVVEALGDIIEIEEK